MVAGAFLVSRDAYDRMGWRRGKPGVDDDVEREYGGSENEVYSSGDDERVRAAGGRDKVIVLFEREQVVKETCRKRRRPRQSRGPDLTRLLATNSKTGNCRDLMAAACMLHARLRSMASSTSAQARD